LKELTSKMRELKERGILAGIEIRRIIALFDDDPIAKKIFVWMAEGKSGEELEQASGLSPTKYQSKRRKIRRHIEKFIEKLKT